MVWVYREEEDYSDERVDNATMKAEIEICKEWASALGHHMYNTGSITGLEESLEELYATLDLDLPKGPPVIQKKTSELFDFALELSRQGEK